jgi:hypothetical protein
MYLRPSRVILFSAIILLLKCPLYVSAQNVQRERLQPDFSAGFQLPSREVMGPGGAERWDKPAVSRWRQEGGTETAPFGWTPRRQAPPGDRTPLLRFKQKTEQGAPGVLRRWRSAADVQERGQAKQGGRGGGLEVDASLPEVRAPLDLRGGQGAVLKGRPVAPNLP